ncbi:hypothetical protein QCM80_28055 [Bradyrhizobium sp. SSUT112]|uniref:hypothetical protein n=1 Tax=Bradyrhizobium sp. SSUT112 TaxID=3040604 RepID=UPI00244BD755|nr:hypothetical protein [Bradyrhizobium sp. SSUT112]MDH2354490.1 hypothetical protein [Bradyrhizobium sp. SSUT112]
MTTPPNLTVISGKSTVAKDERGRFVSGPANTGRPVGSKNRISSELAKQIRALGPRAVEALASAIDEKQSWAIQLVIKLVVPGRLIEMHGSEPADIRNAFESGEISADEMKQISSGLEKLASIESIDDLRARLAELETMLAQR